MLASRPARALLALLLLLAPTAGAFATREEPLVLAYARDAAPVLFGMGRVGLEGEARGGLVVTGARELVLRDVPALAVTERDGDGRPRNQTHRGVDLVVHSGALMWAFGEGGALALDVGAAYGVGLALPGLPLPLGGSEGPGALLAAPSVDGRFAWRGADATLVLLDAEATLLDAAGAPVPGWDRRAVNPGASPASDVGALSVVLWPSGPFEGDAHARVLAAGLGADPDARLSVSPSETPRFAETLDALADLGDLAGDARGEDLFGAGNPLRQLDAFSGLLNGAIVVSGGPGEDEPVEPVEATLGGAPFDVGPLALVRGDLAIAWTEDQTRVEGTPKVAVSRAGFAVDDVASVGLLPVVSLALWLAAAAALVVFFVKRPPKGETSLLFRMVALGVHLLALAAAFWWWDRSFAQTFGTSVLTLLFEDGFSLDALPRLGMVFALETLPWGLAALCFALPVRIALGVALRYLGKGKSLKGLAKAGGFLALGFLGPLYALWLLNAVVGLLGPALGGMMP